MRARAYAKFNLGLLVGPQRGDGKHEIATVLERVDLHDVIELEHVDDEGIVVEGFAEDTLVRRALELFDAASSSRSCWRVHIEKRIPVASGLGGGSSDAAAALRLANELSGEPLSGAALHELASAIGSDVPFFLTSGAKIATGDGTQLEPVELPRGYWLVLALGHDARKSSTRRDSPTTPKSSCPSTYVLWVAWWIPTTCRSTSRARSCKKTKSSARSATRQRG